MFPVLRIGGFPLSERPGDSCKNPPSGGFSVEMMGFLGMGLHPREQLPPGISRLRECVLEYIGEL